MIISSEQWLRPKQDNLQSIQNAVETMLKAIETNGNRKIIEFSQEFDNFEPEIIPLLKPEKYSLPESTLKHLKIAASRIEKYCLFQMEKYEDRFYEDEFGRYGQRIVPIEKIAAYIPGGRFPLASSALMTLIPAKIAGCNSRIALSPNNHPAILAAASLAGATSFIKIGGVQAIASAAYGSSLNEKVNMIVGPGNAYVNAAKSLLQNKIKIDTQAGPSELLIISDGRSNPDWLIADMKAQAEHDPMALSIIISWDKGYLESIERNLNSEEEGQLLLENKQIQLIYANSSNAAINFSNKMGAEHLMLCANEIDSNQLSNYGALFIGEYSAVAMGDYCSGPNHTLPTAGFSKQKGGLQVGDFLRVLSFQEIKASAYPALGETAATLAELEDLKNHKLSIDIRMNK